MALRLTSTRADRGLPGTVRRTQGNPAGVTTLKSRPSLARHVDHSVYGGGARVESDKGGVYGWTRHGQRGGSCWACGSC